MTKLTKWESDKNKSKNYIQINHMHICRPCTKHEQIFKKTIIKLYEELQSLQGTHFYISEVRKW